MPPVPGTPPVRASTVLIAWTPAEYAVTADCPTLRRTAGSVAVIPWPDEHKGSRAYAHVTGACDAAWRTASPEALAASILVTFNTMVLRDGINPLAAHVNLLDLDEYREAIAADLRQRRAAPIRTAAVVDLADYATRMRG